MSGVAAILLAFVVIVVVGVFVGGLFWLAVSDPLRIRGPRDHDDW